MRPVLTKGCGDQLHHQDQHGNSRVIVAGEQCVHCLRWSAGGRVHNDRQEDRAKKKKMLDFLGQFLTIKILLRSRRIKHHQTEHERTHQDLEGTVSVLVKTQHTRTWFCLGQEGQKFTRRRRQMIGQLFGIFHSPEPPPTGHLRAPLCG